MPRTATSKMEESFVSIAKQKYRVVDLKSPPAKQRNKPCRSAHLNILNGPGDSMPQSHYNAVLSGNPGSATSQQYPNGNPDGPLNPPGAKNTDSCVPPDATAEVVHNYASQ